MKWVSLIILLIGALTTAWAAEEPKPADLIAVKASIENMITQRYHDRIATQLPTELFKVAVQVEIEIKKDDTTRPAQANTNDLNKNNNQLSDISLGIIESVNPPENILPKETKNNILIKKVEVMVGLSAKLDSQYRDKFKPWLDSLVKNEFGNLGQTKITELAPLPKLDPITKEKPESPERILTFDEKFGHYQNALGLVVFAVIFLLAVLLLKFLPSRDVKEQVQTSLRIQEMKAQIQNTQNRSQLMEKEKKDKNFEKGPEIQLNANLLFDSLKDHQRKVALLAFYQVSILDTIFARWADEGLEGRKKIAILMDSLLSFYGESAQNNKDSGLNFNLPEKLKNDKQLYEAFQIVAEMSLSQKTVLIEKAYWDLLSQKALSVGQQKKPFASIIELPSNKIHKLLSGQDKKVQSLTILHLPQEKMEQVITDFTMDQKESILINAFETPNVKSQDLELVDESLRFFVQKESALDSSGVDIPTLVPNFLMSLKSSEELQLLSQVLPKLKDKGFYLKQNYPSIAFLPEWPEDKLKSLLAPLPSTDLQCLIRSLPQLQERVLKFIPSRNQIMLKDMLKRPISDDELNRGLDVIRLRLFKWVNDGQIQLDVVFKNAGMGEAA